jgi:hypothetical protein
METVETIEMNKLSKDKKDAILIGSIIAGASIFMIALVGGLSIGSYEQTTYNPAIPDGMIYIVDHATRDLSIADMAFDSQLIIQGRVMDQSEGRTLPAAEQGMIPIPTTNNIVQVVSVIKGDPKLVGKTINVVTEGDASKRVIAPEGAMLKRGENLELFLAKSPVGENTYTIKGVDQGKYTVDKNNNVRGKFIKDTMPVVAFDKNVKKILSEPRPERPGKELRPNDKDLTTEQVKTMEDKLRLDIEGQSNPQQQDNNLERSGQLNPNRQGQEQPDTSQDLTTAENNTTG